MSKHVPGAFRVGRPGLHEKAADVSVGDFDQMSALARLVSVPLCGALTWYELCNNDAAWHDPRNAEKEWSCTRPAGHAEGDVEAPGRGGHHNHPALKHVVAASDGIALAVWR